MWWKQQEHQNQKQSLNETELLQFHDKTFMDEELLLMNEQRKLFLEIKSTPGNDAVKIVEMTIQDLERVINLVGKAVAGSERTDFNFEKKFQCG